MNRELVRGNYRVVLTDETSEGIDGDYSPDRPGDYVHLRYYVDVASDDPRLTGWDDVENASYCTELRADASEAVVQAALTHIADELFPLLDAGLPYKHQAEKLSWMDESWFTK